jgi:DNA polymerase kappa
MDCSGEKPASEPESENYGTLKYQLLGPSLTKAGQDSVDQQKVRCLLDLSLLTDH